MTFNFCFTTTRHVSLFWVRWNQSKPHLTSGWSILLLSSHQCTCHPKGLFRSVFPSKPIYGILLFTINATCHTYLIFLDVVISITLYESTDHKSRNKSTLMTGPSCLSATWKYTHVPRPPCYREHTATGVVHTICGSCCWRYRGLSNCCVFYLWVDLFVWEQQRYRVVSRVRLSILYIIFILVSLKSDTINGCIPWRIIYLHWEVSIISSYNEKCFRSSCRGKQNTTFVLIPSTKIMPFIG